MKGVEQFVASLLEQVPRRVHSELFDGVLLSPWFYGSLIVVLALEWFLPAKPMQRSSAAGVRHDLLWVLLGIPIGVVAIASSLIILRALYRTHLSFLTIHQVKDWPWLARVLLALAFSDLVKWCTHVARHKVPLFWHFHAVHHSQKELNFFSDFRIHPGDHAADILVRSIPTFMVDHSFATVAVVEWLRQWHARVYHANIRSNFGLLRYILVTPQSHRIHHSVDPRHADRNFAAMFSVWDYLFGTQYHSYDEYPDTGIRDPTFSFEQDYTWRGSLRCFWDQLLYPSRAAWRSLVHVSGDPDRAPVSR